MALLFYVFQALGVYALTRLAWIFIRPLVHKDPLAALPRPSGGSILFGHLAKLTADNTAEYLAELVEKEGAVVNIGKCFGNDALVVSDPKALYHVLLKDQAIFEEPSETFAMRDAIFGPGILAAHGEQHRRQRKLLNPLFSINHMRNMVPKFHEITEKLSSTLASLVTAEKREIEIFEWLTRCALELIGQSGFGYSFDPLTEDYTEHPYATSTKLLSPLIIKTLIPQFLVLPIVYKWNLGGKALQRWVMNNLTWGSIRALKDVVNGMDHTSNEIYTCRKKTWESNLGGGGDGNLGKDILTVLMKANMETSGEDKLPDQEILAQISSFVFAGMDTTSSALGRLLWLLSKHQDAQDRLRAEIRDAKAIHGLLNYDQIVALPYLDAICRETLRLYPPVSFITRSAVKDTVLPLLKPMRGSTGENITEIAVPADTRIFISITGCNLDRDLWGEDAREWKPERWLSDLPSAITEAKVPGVYSNLMTFMGGSRACIGFKFSQLEMKVLTISLLDRLKFSLGDKEIFWRSFGLVTPGVNRSKLRPELPILVELVK